VEALTVKSPTHVVLDAPSSSGERGHMSPPGSFGGGGFGNGGGIGGGGFGGGDRGPSFDAIAPVHELPPPATPDIAASHFELPAPSGGGSVVPTKSDEAKPIATPGYAASMIDEKHREYVRNSRSSKRLYYLTRWMTGLASIALAIAGIATQGVVLKVLAICCPVAILVSTLIDTIHDPKGRWKLFSTASDRLALAELRRRGEFDAYKEQLKILVETENAKLEKLTDISQVVETIQSASKK
jgi:hypothetical protein